MRGRWPPEAFILQIAHGFGTRGGQGNPSRSATFFAPKESPHGVAKMGSAGMLGSHPKSLGHCG